MPVRLLRSRQQVADEYEPSVEAAEAVSVQIDAPEPVVQASVQVEFSRIEQDIEVLITGTRKSIATSDAFIASMQ